MTLKIAVLADIHFGTPFDIPGRRDEFADILLLRAVRRLNRFIKPDVTVVLGDLIHDNQSSSAIDDLRRLKAIIDLIESPVIVLPGNHDVAPDTFYSVFTRPADHLDLKGVRLVPFIDINEANYNASRCESDLQRMAGVRQDFTGPLVALQHVSLFPPGESACPFNYLNADKIVAAMRQNGYVLTISGHYHEGLELLRNDGPGFLAVPALCESPFRFWEVFIDGNTVSVNPHQLQMSPELHLIDRHVHTPYAYCSENMDIPKTLTLARDFGLDGLIFTEHSSHLYYDRPSIYAGRHFTQNAHLKKTSVSRIDSYFADLENASVAPASQGLEVDSDYEGRPMLLPEDRRRTHFFVGSVHRLQSLDRQEPDVEKICDNFLAVHEKFLTTGIHVLAHPFRIFAWAKRPVPEPLFTPLVNMLRKNNVAAEINFHGNLPPAEFYRLCLKAGIKLSFGSDSHNLCDIGEFTPHLALLRSIGFNGDVNDILL